MTTEFVFKLIELLSKNWIYVLSLLVLVPLMKFAINSLVQIQLAKINNPSKISALYEDTNSKRSLEIISHSLKVSDIQKALPSYTITLNSPEDKIPSNKLQLK